jgi:hypothetical protein
MAVLSKHAHPAPKGGIATDHMVRFLAPKKMPAVFAQALAVTKDGV